MKNEEHRVPLFANGVTSSQVSAKMPTAAPHPIIEGPLKIDILNNLIAKFRENQ